ncbi:MAG: type II toxin-antitoxin system RelE/ParE family toxin [Alphaproteobacteria bacterium]|nr:type II toxin-antitoxin system RelE/ParE family toxin [Alphaproteobacteria bacterium]
MYQIILDKRVIKFIQAIPQKHQRQLKKYILSFQNDPRPHDSKTLKDYEPYRRGDCGEYRIVYRLAESEKTVHVILVGKRNGNEVYQQLKMLLV